MAKIGTKQPNQNPNTFLKKILQSILDEERGRIHYHHSKKTATDLFEERIIRPAWSTRKSRSRQFLAWQDLEGPLGSSWTLLPLAPKIYHYFCVWSMKSIYHLEGKSNGYEEDNAASKTGPYSVHSLYTTNQYFVSALYCILFPYFFIKVRKWDWLFCFQPSLIPAGAVLTDTVINPLFAPSLISPFSELLEHGESMGKTSILRKKNKRLLPRLKTLLIREAFC